MSLTNSPENAERQAALGRLSEVREKAASRLRHRRLLARGAACACLMLAAAAAWTVVVAPRHSVHIAVEAPSRSQTLWPTPDPASFRSYKPEAQALIGRLESDFVPPPGATVPTGDPPADLSQPATGIGPGEVLTTHRLWVVPGTPTATMAFLQTHVVTGAIQGDSGSAVANPSTMWFDEDVPGAAVHGAVTPEVILGSGNTTILRVDFQVAYSPGRPKGMEVTAADRYVSITRNSESPSAAHQVAFTDPATVVGLANAFNALVSTSSSGLTSCPRANVSYKVSFSSSATTTPDFVAEGPGCGVWYVTQGAKTVGQLVGSDALNSLLSSLVGS